MGHVLKSKDLSGHTALILKAESCADMIGLQLPKLFSYLTASFAGKLSRFGNHASDFFAKRQYIIEKFWSMILQPWQDILHDVDLLQESNALVVIQLVPVFGGAMPDSVISAPLQPPLLHSIIVMRIHSCAKGLVCSTNPKRLQTLRQNSRHASSRSWSSSDQVATSTTIAVASSKSFSFVMALGWE